MQGRCQENSATSHVSDTERTTISMDRDQLPDARLTRADQVTIIAVGIGIVLITILLVVLLF